MAAGVRSLLAFWAGGAAASPTQAGVKSPLAFWMGGAAASPVVSSAGVRSLLAFWMGGAAATAVEEPQPAGGGGGASGGIYTRPLRRPNDAALVAERTEEQRAEPIEAEPRKAQAGALEAAQPNPARISHAEAQRQLIEQIAARIEREIPAASVSPAQIERLQVKLPDGRIITAATAETEEDRMALLMFAMFVAMDD